LQETPEKEERSKPNRYLLAETPSAHKEVERLCSEVAVLGEIRRKKEGVQSADIWTSCGQAETVYARLELKKTRVRETNYQVAPARSWEGALDHSGLSSRKTKKPKSEIAGRDQATVQEPQAEESWSTCEHNLAKRKKRNRNQNRNGRAKKKGRH